MPPSPSSVAVTADAASRAEVSDPAPAPGPAPQSGVLTAGDYDDLLNPGLYTDYVAQYLQGRRDDSLPYLDTATAITVRVTDRQRRPLPFAWVQVDRAGGQPLMLSTAADGTVRLFPAHDRLGSDVHLTVRRPDGQGRDAVMAFRPDQLSADRTVEVRLDAEATRPTQLDLALVIDATGSMADEMRYVQAELRAILDWLGRALPGVDVQVGLVVYRDVGDEYVTRTFALTGDIDSLQRDLAAQSAQGGGDYPEAMHTALEQAYDLDWRENAVRVAFLVADAPPHARHYGDTWDVAEQAREGRIHIVPVAGSGVGDAAEYMMRAMAALTQSRYLFLTDDSGVGLPHDTPSVKCYQVTRLDSLMRRVIASLFTGERVEASPEEVIRTVGRYDRGVCRAPGR